MYHTIYDAKKRMTLDDIASIDNEKYKNFVQTIFSLGFDESPDYYQLI